jgi:hypothetical protein
LVPPPIRNDQITLVALLVLGADKSAVDTEDVAMKADELAPGRFRWRKFKEHIDLGLVRNGLQDARKKGLTAGGALRGWALTEIGTREARSLLPRVSDDPTRERLATEQRQWETRERTRLLAEPSFRLALETGADSLTKRDILRLFKLDEYASTERTAERTRRFSTAFADDQKMKRILKQLIRRLENE